MPTIYSLDELLLGEGKAPIKEAARADTIPILTDDSFAPPSDGEAVPEPIKEACSRSFYAAPDSSGQQNLSLLYVDSRYMMDRHSAQDVHSWQEAGKQIVKRNIDLFIATSVYGARSVYIDLIHERKPVVAIINSVLRLMPFDNPDPGGGYDLVRKMRRLECHLHTGRAYIVGCTIGDSKLATFTRLEEEKLLDCCIEQGDICQQIASALNRYKMR